MRYSKALHERSTIIPVLAESAKDAFCASGLRKTCAVLCVLTFIGFTERESNREGEKGTVKKRMREGERERERERKRKREGGRE